VRIGDVTNTLNDAPSAGLDILAKADAVITALESEQELTAQQLAEAVNEPVSSTYRLLQSLAAIDWIEPGEKRGLYRLGVYFMRIGGRFEDRLDVRREAFEPLRTLRLGTGWTSVLCVRRGSRSVCVERFDGLYVRSVAMQVGDSFPLYVGAAALTLLANLPVGEQLSLLAQFARRAGSSDDPLAPPHGELQERLDRIRADGFAWSENEVTAGFLAIAAPVFNHRRELAASVSVSGLRSATTDDRNSLTEHVRATAAEISNRLGFRE
jgi:DNA-binding IclR family transcriptional regulator